MAVVAVIVDGAPALGSDFGGVIALVPAFGTLGILASGRRLSWARLAVLVGAGVVVVGTIATLDYLRPEEDRTHLGRFVESVLTGDAGTVVQRKIDANRLAAHQQCPDPDGAAGPALPRLPAPPAQRAVAMDLRTGPTLRAGLAGVLVLGVVGALLNDSGVAIPAMAATVAIPVAVAVMVRCMGLEGASEPRVTAEPERVG